MQIREMFLNAFAGKCCLEDVNLLGTLFFCDYSLEILWVCFRYVCVQYRAEDFSNCWFHSNFESQSMLH